MDHTTTHFRVPVKIRLLASVLLVIVLSGFQQSELHPGHPSLQEWILKEQPQQAMDTAEQVALGKMLFFDPRLSGDGSISCASCHNPALGWSNGLATGIGFQGQVLRRASPTIVNAGFNSLYHWDGAARTLEQQALFPLLSPHEMRGDIDAIITWLQLTPEYSNAFELAFPEQDISSATLTKAIAAFERTIISNDSPFDRWVKGDAEAMTSQQVRGLGIFLSEESGNCSGCHSAPNFTDDSFHNIGLASQSLADADLGRFEILPIAILKGAFKTPTLRDISLSAPYFHDGSANTLEEVVEHYVRGGEVEDNLSPDMKPLDLTDQEKEDLVAFLHALTTTPDNFDLPILPVSASTPSNMMELKSYSKHNIVIRIDE